MKLLAAETTSREPDEQLRYVRRPGSRVLRTEPRPWLSRDLKDRLPRGVLTRPCRLHVILWRGSSHETGLQFTEAAGTVGKMKLNEW